MEKITIITTGCEPQNKKFHPLCNITDDNRPNLKNMFHVIKKSISYDDWFSNDNAVTWFNDKKQIIGKISIFLREVIKKNNIKEKWNEIYETIKEVAEDSPHDFPFYDSIVGTNFNQVYASTEERLFILPVFKKDSKEKSERYIERFIKIAHELSGLDEFLLNICFHASDFEEYKNEDKIGYCIYKKKKTIEKKIKYYESSEEKTISVNVWFFSHVDNAIYRFIKGANEYSAKELFDEKTYLLHDDIDKPLKNGTCKNEIIKNICDIIKMIDKK